MAVLQRFYISKKIKSNLFLKKVLTKTLNSCIVTNCAEDNSTEPNKRLGRLAQLGEHLPYKQEVIGSSPIAPTNLRRKCQGNDYGQVVQLVRMPACHAGGHEFEPRLGRQFL